MVELAHYVTPEGAGRGFDSYLRRSIFVTWPETDCAHAQVQVSWARAFIMGRCQGCAGLVGARFAACRSCGGRIYNVEGRRVRIAAGRSPKGVRGAA